MHWIDVAEQTGVAQAILSRFATISRQDRALARGRQQLRWPPRMPTIELAAEVEPAKVEP